jgi:hypothetical protein
VKKTMGADGDHVDVYLGPHAHEAEKHPVFVVDQQHADTHRFDEHKAMLGFRDLDHATNTYDKAFSDKRGPERRRAVHQVSLGDFKHWVANGDTTRAFGDKPAKKRNTLGKRVDTSLEKGVIATALEAGRRYGTALGARVAAHPRIAPILARPRVAAGLHEMGAKGWGGVRDPGNMAGRVAGAAIAGKVGAKVGGHVGTAADIAPTAIAVGGAAAAGLGIGRETAPGQKKPRHQPQSFMLGKAAPRGRSIYTTPLKHTLREHLRIIAGGTPSPHHLSAIAQARRSNTEAAQTHIPAALAAIAGAARITGAMQT